MADTDKPDDIVRVLRILEYTGPRRAVEAQIERSVTGKRTWGQPGARITLRAATIGTYPEVLNAVLPSCDAYLTHLEGPAEACVLPLGHAGLHSFQRCQTMQAGVWCVLARGHDDDHVFLETSGSGLR
jgi:hypothetical protein